MTDDDYLYCILNLWLDDDELLASLCPDCRARAESDRCPACGGERPNENPGFDRERFNSLKEGGNGLHQ